VQGLAIGGVGLGGETTGSVRGLACVALRVGQQPLPAGAVGLRQHAGRAVDIL
jgi:hypothetical protein